MTCERFSQFCHVTDLLNNSKNHTITTVKIIEREVWVKESKKWHQNMKAASTETFIAIFETNFHNNFAFSSWNGGTGKNYKELFAVFQIPEENRVAYNI